MVKTPDIPANEAQRLAHLLALNILDTAPEERLDNVTRLAADIFAKPVALISLVDNDRQWFKSRHGLDIEQTEREVSFCAHVVADQQPLVVEDTLKDPRFQDNRLVQQDEKPIRFYAGAPISSPDGHVLGSLCVIDHQPASFTEVGAEGNRTINRARKQLVAAITHTEDNQTKGLISQAVESLDELRQLMDALCDTTETAQNNEWAPTDLNDTVKHGRNVLVSRFGERVDVLFKPVDGLALIPTVESQLFMALLNVLTNAAESRRGPVKIKIELVEKPDHIQIRVQEDRKSVV